MPGVSRKCLKIYDMYYVRYHNCIQKEGGGNVHCTRAIAMRFQVVWHGVSFRKYLEFHYGHLESIPCSYTNLTHPIGTHLLLHCIQERCGLLCQEKWSGKYPAVLTILVAMAL